MTVIMQVCVWVFGSGSEVFGEQENNEMPSLITHTHTTHSNVQHNSRWKSTKNKTSDMSFTSIYSLNIANVIVCSQCTWHFHFHSLLTWCHKNSRCGVTAGRHHAVNGPGPPRQPPFCTLNRKEQGTLGKRRRKRAHGKLPAINLCKQLTFKPWWLGTRQN